MREYGLSDAVATFATYSEILTSLWGLYIVATFAAAGFGASMSGQFTPQSAAMLTIAFLAFAGAHLRGLLMNVKGLIVIREEVLARLRSGADDITDFPATVAAGVTVVLGPTASLVVHLVIDACVVGVIWASVSWV